MLVVVGEGSVSVLLPFSGGAYLVNGSWCYCMNDDGGKADEGTNVVDGHRLGLGLVTQVRPPQRIVGRGIGAEHPACAHLRARDVPPGD